MRSIPTFIPLLFASFSLMGVTSTFLSTPLFTKPFKKYHRKSPFPMRLQCGTFFLDFPFKKAIYHDLNLILISTLEAVKLKSVLGRLTRSGFQLSERVPKFQ
ncbi:hypothetical protein DFH28DRAFT_978427 [Melampsora americana]|nr:hypothetical protein DFH28DRAFT_978427 [Melampsora americana]